MAKTQAEKDADMKEAIKKQLAAGTPAAPAKSQAEKDAEMKAAIKKQLAAGATAAPVKSQAEKDEEMKAAIKKQLAAGTPAAPAKSQAEKDAEMKAAIKKQLAAGSTQAPVKSQADKDAEMKAAIKKQLASGNAPAAKTQAQKDEEMKAAIKAQLASGSAPAPAPAPAMTQAEKDAEIKRQIQAELKRPPPSQVPQTQDEKDAAMKAAIKQQLAAGKSQETTQAQKKDEELAEESTPNDEDVKAEAEQEGDAQPRSAGTRTSRRQARRSDQDDALKAQARASREAVIPARGEPGAASNRSLQVGDGISSRQVTSVAVLPQSPPEIEEEEEVDEIVPRTSNIGGRLSTSEKERPAPAGEEEGVRVGAISVATRAYGGMPAWIRQQAEQNRQAQNARISESSTLPPEMRGLTEEEDDWSHLPPELRAAAPEASPEDEPDVPTAEVAPIKAPESEGSGRLWIYVLAAVVIIAAAGAGAGIALGGGGDKPPEVLPTRSPTPSPTSSPTALVVPECTGYPDIDVDPENMDSATLVRYMDLMTNFAPNYWPEYSGPVKARDYCSPEHIALVWLAYDDPEATLDEQSLEYRLLLSTIYFRTNGNIWKGNTTTWLSPSDECTWDGVTCGVNGEIIELSLVEQFFIPQKDDKGDFLITNMTFPLEVSFITSLRSLKLNANRIVGAIPSDLGNLVNLEILDLSTNSFTGTFPFSDLWSLVNLRVLSLDANDGLTVPIPAEIGTWSNLEMISFIGTGAGGDAWTLPTQIGTLSKLAVLSMAHSNLDGIIPTEIGNLASLEFLDFRFNTDLDGTIPTEMGNLASLQTLLFDGILGGGVTGTLPSEIGNMGMLETFVVSKLLGITGTIPTEIARCSMLETLVLAETGVQGIIPSEFDLLTNLVYLDLASTVVGSTIPSAILSLPNLVKLDVTNSFITGTIILDVTNMTNLVCFGIGSTSIQGILSTENNCEFPFLAEGDELAICEKVDRQSCACCTNPGAVCPDSQPLIEVDRCGYIGMESVNNKQIIPSFITDILMQNQQRLILA